MRTEAERLWRMASGFAYRDAHYLSVELPVDADVARRWVPGPLRLARPARATLFGAWFPHTSFGSTYREGGLFLHVEHRGTEALFCPWMVVDDDVALIVGRELLGYPKKLATITFAIDGDRIESTAERRGARIFSLRGTLGAVVPDAPPMLGRPHRNVRTSLGVAAPKILAFTPREVPIVVRRADLEVEVFPAARDPLAELGFGRPTAAYLHRVDLAASGVPLPIALASPRWQLESLLLRSH